MTTNNNFYLKRFAQDITYIKEAPNPDLELLVVIPCFNEESIIPTLTSLFEAEETSISIEIIIVINQSETASAEITTKNTTCKNEANTWIESHQTEKKKFYIIEALNLPKKHAGVGLARKTGMDEAVRRLETVNKPEGIIVCFDADSLCEKNYFTSIYNHFKNNPKTSACGLHYEHPLEDNNHDSTHVEAIIQYELHLRYYVDALKWSGLTHAFQTIGSSMAVRNIDYQKEGGMNKRKAGEDFYFLQKFIQLGTFSEIKNTKVIPSPRVSDRVPFGTGKAVGDFLLQKDETSYSFQTFVELKTFLSQFKKLFKATQEETNQFIETLPTSIKTFLIEQNIFKQIEEINTQSKNFDTFENRFFRWFNAFMGMKYVHYTRDNYYPNESTILASQKLLERLNTKKLNNTSAKMLLLKFREIDRKD